MDGNRGVDIEMWSVTRDVWVVTIVCVTVDRRDALVAVVTINGDEAESATCPSLIRSMVRLISIAETTVPPIIARKQTIQIMLLRSKVPIYDFDLPGRSGRCLGNLVPDSGGMISTKSSG